MTARTRGSARLDRWPGSVWRSVLTGGVTGSCVGLALGLVAARGLRDVLVLYLLGFLVGALTGAAAGLLVAAWERRRRRRPAAVRDPGRTHLRAVTDAAPPTGGDPRRGQ